MEAGQFSFEQQKFLVKSLEGAWSFVPPRLPPQMDMGTVAVKLAAAANAVGELNGAARRLQNPYMLITPLIRKEALTTSAMEGTITTIDDMLLQEIVPATKKDDDAREAYNYVEAVRKTTQSMKSLPISGRLIKEGHRILLSGLSAERGAGKMPGEFKKLQNAIGDSRDNIFTARYVPPPPQSTPQCMAELEAFINRDDRKVGEELIDIALAHYQFEAIHPFQDGNGRMGRMMVTLMAMQMRLMDLPLLHVSATLEKVKPQYIDRLFAVSTTGAWTEWMNFFLDVIRESCKNATAIVDRVIALHGELKKKALQNNNNHRLPSIIDALFSKEWTTASEVASLCSVTFPTAQSDIQELIRLEILRPIPNTRPAICVAPAIWDLSRRD